MMIVRDNRMSVDLSRLRVVGVEDPDMPETMEVDREGTMEDAIDEVEHSVEPVWHCLSVSSNVPKSLPSHPACGSEMCEDSRVIQCQ